MLRVRLRGKKINKRGYSKFLKLENDVNISISDDKIREDEMWDGLKGYITNSSLPPSEVVSQYFQLNLDRT